MERVSAEEIARVLHASMATPRAAAAWDDWRSRPHHTLDANQAVGRFLIEVAGGPYGQLADVFGSIARTISAAVGQVNAITFAESAG